MHERKNQIAESEDRAGPRVDLSRSHFFALGAPEWPKSGFSTGDRGRDGPGRTSAGAR
jgi:hypothetical protein